jgi:hypothetical protein
MLGLFDNLDEELNQSLKRIEMIKGKEGFTKVVKDNLKKNYASYPLTFEYIGGETLGTDIYEETFPAVIDVLKWAIYKRYRSLQHIKEAEGDCVKPKEIETIRIMNQNDFERFEIDKKVFGYTDKPATITAKSILVAQVSFLFVTFLLDYIVSNSHFMYLSSKRTHKKKKRFGFSVEEDFDIQT